MQRMGDESRYRPLDRWTFRKLINKHTGNGMNRLIDRQTDR